MAYKLQLKRGLLSALPIGISGEPLFTTDTNDLYISNGTTNQKFQKFIASGTSSQFLKGDGSLDSNTYYLSSNPSAYITLTALTASSPLSYNNTTGAFTIAQSSGSVSGYLSSTDWTTFNNKQNTITNPVTGTGTTNYLPKWTSGSAIGNSLVYDDGTNVGINLPSPAVPLDVLGKIRTRRTIETDQYIDISSVGGEGFIEAINSNSETYQPIIFKSGNNVNTIERARITSTGNLLVNSTTDSGERFQVSGTMKVTGAATFSNSVTASSFIKSGGTSSQYLMADGSVSTGGGGGSVDELQVALISQVYG